MFKIRAVKIILFTYYFLSFFSILVHIIQIVSIFRSIPYPQKDIINQNYHNGLNNYLNLFICLFSH